MTITGEAIGGPKDRAMLSSDTPQLAVTIDGGRGYFTKHMYKAYPTPEHESRYVWLYKGERPLSWKGKL